MDTPLNSPDERTLDTYLKELRSGKPTPGGGSASAYAGALGASLGAMVCRLTLGRASGDDNAVLIDLADSLDIIVDRFSHAARDDELVYSRYQAATKLPKSTDDEKRARREARQEALRLAAEAPLVTADLAVGALETLPTIAKHGTQHALSDIETAIVLLNAAVQGALINVQVNIDMIASEEIIGELTSRSDQVRYRAAVTLDLISAELRARQS